MAATATKAKSKRGTVLPADWAGNDYWEPDRQMVLILNRLGFKWEFVQYAPTDLPTVTAYGERGDNLGDGTRTQGMFQVRTHTHTDIVDGYEATLRRGEKLPTTTWDFSLNGIDAHHRYLAAIAAGIDNFVIIRLKDVLDRVDRDYIATIRNQTHGLRMSQGEVLVAALKVVTTKGLPVDDVARELNVPASSLRRAIDDQVAQERARSLKVEAEFAKLGKGVRAELATLHDEPFKELAKVFSVRQPRAVQAVDIIKEVRSQPSDRKALEVIKRVKEVDLLPQAAQGTVSGITAGPLTVAEAFRLSQAPLKAFETLFTNKRVIDALLKATVTDTMFSKVNTVLGKIKPNFDALCKHYGV
jgi:hypothetical protein